jgi:hypothetical protein
MKYRNLFSLCTAMLLFSVIPVNSALTNACFCGTNCSHTLPVNASSPFHGRCSNNQCKSCHLEEGKILKATKSLTSVFHFKLLDAKPMSFIMSDDLFTNHILTTFNPAHFRLSDSSPTIYLENLSIRC